MAGNGRTTAGRNRDGEDRIMGYAVKWNKLDAAIAFCEDKCRKLRKAYQDSSDAEPDPEEMILAETEHLRRENEGLRKRETPVYLLENGAEQYYCPVCRQPISDPNFRYCPDCGHRVMRHIPLPFET